MPRVNYWNWNLEGAQIRAINELDEELAAQAGITQRRIHETKRELQSHLSQVDRRLVSVADRIDTVLEWTELRFQLIEFDEYAARKAIRKPFRALAGGLPATAPDVADVPGYWMPPAALALLRLVARGGAPSGPFADLSASLELARERDAVRAELFSLTVALCFDQPAFIDAAVLRLLGEPADLGLAEPGEVAAGWRALWEHAARGEFGPSAADLLTERLAAMFDPETLDEEELRAWDEAILSFGGVESAPLPKTEAFALLREHLSDAEAPQAAGGTVEPDERWRRYLQELIEEPSPAELPLVEAMEELHLSEDRLQRSKPTWSEPEGSVAELLRQDLFDPDGPVALRALALELAAPLLRSRIELVGESPESTEPIIRIVKRVGSKVRVGRDGHDAAELEAAERRIEQHMDLEGPSAMVAVVTAAGFALAGLVLVFNGLWPLALLCLIGVVAPVWRYSKGKSEQAAKRDRCDQQLADLRAELIRAREGVREAEDERAERTAAVGRARDELLAALPGARSGTANH
ncbi:hypothetical protein [Glycomyces arizonensis]|uniref:hypothetical protein n=1 Tax=Glycomyces arizonensis TaxID=256035 RepID=UPI00040F20D2|nr:hypothetical protein [Glycomyces arizonensis]